MKKSVKVGGVTFRVDAIGKKAAYGRESLKSLVIEKGIKKIGAYAFSYCWRLKEIRITGKVTFGASAFESISSKVRVTIRDVSGKTEKEMREKIESQKL